MSWMEFYEKFIGKLPGEDSHEYHYRLLMAFKRDILEYLRKNPEDDVSCAALNDTLKQVNKAEKAYEVLAYAKLYGTEDSDDESEEEYVDYESAREIHQMTGDVTEVEDTGVLLTANDETQDSLSEMELAEIGAAKLREYAQWIHSNEVEPEADQFVMPYSEPDTDTGVPEIVPNCTEETFPSEDSDIDPIKGTLDEKNQEDSSLLDTDQLPPDPGKPNGGTKASTGKHEEFFENSAKRDEFYEVKSNREPLIKGRVFDVGKMEDSNLGQYNCKNPDVRVTPEDLGDIVTTKSGGRKTPMNDSTFPYEPGGLPEDEPVNFESELKLYEDTPHKEKEKVNSPCSQVWKVKTETYGDPEAEMHKIQRKPRPSNKQLKPGWDPPIIDMESEDSIVEKVCSSNGKSRTTTGQNNDKRPSMDFTVVPKKVEAHDSMPKDPGKDPGRSLRPSHKLKEKVNSKCSRVWKVKDEKSNQAWMAKNKSGGKPLASNKRLKRGWDPPAICAF